MNSALTLRGEYMKRDDTQTQGSDARQPATRARGAGIAPVLVVDDDDSIRETLRFALEEEGYEVLVAKDGAVALDLMRREERRLVVLLDHIMPVVDGMTVLQRLSTEREIARRHACVLITASARVANLNAELNALPIAPVSIVLKPFDLDTLFAAVREANTRIAADV
jgi:two-component system response regulator MprA